MSDSTRTKHAKAKTLARKSQRQVKRQMRGN